MGPRQVLAMAAAMAGVASVSAAQSGSVKVPLAPAQPGGLPDGFQVARTGKGAPAAWSVVADPGVQGGQVLVQTSTDQTDYRFPLAIYGGVTAANVEVTVRFKAVAGRIDRAGGIAVRLADPDNYYVLRANALEDNVNFYRVVQGSRRQIHGVAAKVTSDQWHTLSLRAEGGVRWRDVVHGDRSDLLRSRPHRAVDQGGQRHAIRRTDDPGIAIKIWRETPHDSRSATVPAEAATDERAF
jgi:hypothetical protein